MEEEEEVPPMDQEAVEGAMDDTNDGLGSNRKSDGWYQRWIWMAPTMDQEAVGGAMDDTNDGSGSSRRRDGSGSSRWFIKITTYSSTNYYYFCYFYYLN